MSGPLLFDRVMETTTTTGTGTLTLAGAVTGFRSFSVVGNGNTCLYALQAVDSGGVPTGEWETGIGTYATSGTTLARTTVLESSNSNSVVSLSAGTKRVFIAPLAQIASVFLHPTNTEANLTAAQAGRVLFPSNSFWLKRDGGSALVPWGPIYPLTDPALAGLSAFNQGSATITSTYGGIVLARSATDANTRGVAKTAPSTPYTITALFSTVGLGSYTEAGIGFRNSGSGALTGISILQGTAQWWVRYWSSTSVITSNIVATNATPSPSMAWVRISDNGTTRRYLISDNGQDFLEVTNEAHTANFTPNQVCFYIVAYGGAVQATLMSWKET